MKGRIPVGETERAEGKAECKVYGYISGLSASALITLVRHEDHLGYESQSVNKYAEGHNRTDNTMERAKCIHFKPQNRR